MRKCTYSLREEVIHESPQNTSIQHHEVAGTYYREHAVGRNHVLSKLI